MQHDLVRTLLEVLVIAALVVVSFWILSPFLAAIVWSMMIVVSTWPIFLRIQAMLWGRRGLAIALMTLLILLVLFVPLSLAIDALVTHGDQMAAWVKKMLQQGLPPPPGTLKALPLIGEPLFGAWQKLIEAGLGDQWKRLAPYAGDTFKWIAARAGGLGLVGIHFVLTAVISAILYANGEIAAEALRRFARRLAGDAGVGSVVLAAQAIRAVAIGIVVTALVQSLIGAIGLLIASVPYAGVLTALMFMLCIAQLGPGFILIPVVAWLYWRGETGWASFLLVWSVGVISIDNFLRPILIKRGADLPLLLIFAGVIGGLLTMGLLGLFVGPVVLAVTYRLTQAWIDEASGLSPAAPTAAAAAAQRNASNEDPR